MKNFNDVRKNENKGFSLIELIVVVAIMAVMTAVLAPSLLQYVERSRAQKDDSAMGEVTNAVKLALADQDVYDEVLNYTCKYVASCYVDNTVKTVAPAAISTNHDGSEFIYGDEVRQNDEDAYLYAGKMRGMTITFLAPTAGAANSHYFVLGNGIVNEGEISGAEYINHDATSPKGTLMSAMTSVGGNAGCLFNRVTGMVGEKVKITSQTYRNSDYTVFIRMGTTGGSAANGSSVAVYGQWNGTNLYTGQKAAETASSLFEAVKAS